MSPNNSLSSFNNESMSRGDFNDESATSAMPFRLNHFSIASDTTPSGGIGTKEATSSPLSRVPMAAAQQSDEPPVKLRSKSFKSRQQPANNNKLVKFHNNASLSESTTSNSASRALPSNSVDASSSADFNLNSQDVFLTRSVLLYEGDYEADNLDAKNSDSANESHSSSTSHFDVSSQNDDQVPFTVTKKNVV